MNRAQTIADRLGIETNYEIEDYEGSLICHVSADHLGKLINALREADIRFGSLEVYEDAAFSIAETLEIEHEDLTDFAIT